ncbi:DNA repair protein RadC [Aerococcaceae bacterium zg-BR22]|uniref:RadC family protein n=1 Tax=Aerococcaceae bacterium zg-1292 TaxID=2774330 RepID=UPI004062A0CA|nr:DNA repair protein RadC [Aerococcaceae bacterium zg-BR22]
MDSKVLSFIEEVPSQSRPRERLLEYGEKALSDHELLAIILRTGTRNEHVLQLSMRLLQRFENLAGLSLASIDELQEVPGIGTIKAVELKAVIELGLRITASNLPKFGKIRSTLDIGNWMKLTMKDFHQEHLIAVFLNTKNEILKHKNIFIGTVNSSVAHPRESTKCSLLKR